MKMPGSETSDAPPNVADSKTNVAGEATGQAIVSGQAAASEAAAAPAATTTAEANPHSPPAVDSPGRGRWLLFNLVIPLAILAAGAGFVVAVGTFTAKGREEEDQSRVGRLRRLPAAAVNRVLSLEETGRPLELRVDGVVVPYREVQIAAEVSGRIIEKSDQFRAGNFVTEGQLLCRIDPTDYKQEVLRLSRMRDQDYEAIRELDQEVANTSTLIDVAKQDVELAERELARMREMPRGFVSETEIDQARKSLLASTQSRLTLENQLRLLRARRGRLEASERLATTQLETAQINLERCEIRSPADGVIVREDAELNSFIQRGSPILTLEDVSKAEVAVNLRMDQLYWVLDQDRGATLPETLAESLSENSRLVEYSLPPTPAVVEYEVAGLGGMTYRWRGRLSRYDGIGLDSRTRTVPVRIEVDAPRRTNNPDADDGSPAAGPSALVRGMYVRVRLQIQPTTPLVAVPSLAIRPGNRIWHFVPDEGVLDEPAADVPVVGDVSAEAVAAGEPAIAGDVSAADDGTPAAAARLGSEPQPADDFDPRKWVPGRVIALGNLKPVDSLWLPDSAAGPPGAAAADGGERRYWICDVNGGRLQAGDWVVVSPLGKAGEELGELPVAVRVPLEQLSGYEN